MKRDLPSIESMIPQRDPFLMIDRIVDASSDSVIAEKTFSADEDFFRGHFPDKPITPGVLLCEICFQSGAYLMSFRGQEKSAGQVALVTRIRQAKFKEMVLPGQKIQCTVRFVDQLGPAVNLKAKLSVEEKTVATIEFACAYAKGDA